MGLNSKEKILFSVVGSVALVNNGPLLVQRIAASGNFPRRLDFTLKQINIYSLSFTDRCMLTQAAL